MVDRLDQQQLDAAMRAARQPFVAAMGFALLGLIQFITELGHVGFQLTSVWWIGCR
jgi:hypothetical protein